MPERYRPILAAFLLMVLAAPLQGFGETPEKYARRWKLYGDQEVDVLSWRQQKDGTWVATYKVLDQLIDYLFRGGIISPHERDLFRARGSVFQPFGVRHFQEACRSGVLSEQECRAGVAVRASNATPVPLVSLLGVNCTSLMVNRKPAGQGWGKWMRPAEGSYDEQLLVDRCAITKDNQYRRVH